MAKKKGKADYFHEIFGPPALKLELALLYLAELKENFKYREYFKELKKDPYALWPRLVRPDEDITEKPAQTADLNREKRDRFISFANELDLNPLWLFEGTTLLCPWGITGEQVLTLLDPANETIEDRNSEIQQEQLPKLFARPGITELLMGDETKPFRLLPRPQSYERVLLFDLRKSKSVLMAEFEHFFNNFYRQREAFGPGGILTGITSQRLLQSVCWPSVTIATA